MSEQKIHVLGNDEIVLIFGLLGIAGTILNQKDSFFKAFDNLLKQPSIGVIIVALDIRDDSEIVDFLINFKLKRRRPFVYYLPNIFQTRIDVEDSFSNKFVRLIEKIITQ